MSRLYLDAYHEAVDWFLERDLRAWGELLARHHASLRRPYAKDWRPAAYRSAMMTGTTNGLARASGRAFSDSPSYASGRAAWDALSLARSTCSSWSLPGGARCQHFRRQQIDAALALLNENDSPTASQTDQPIFRELPFEPYPHPARTWWSTFGRQPPIHSRPSSGSGLHRCQSK